MGAVLAAIYSSNSAQQRDNIDVTEYSMLNPGNFYFHLAVTTAIFLTLWVGLEQWQWLAMAIALWYTARLVCPVEHTRGLDVHQQQLEQRFAQELNNSCQCWFSW